MDTLMEDIDALKQVREPHLFSTVHLIVFSFWCVNIVVCLTPHLMQKASQNVYKSPSHASSNSEGVSTVPSMRDYRYRGIVIHL